MAEAIYLVRVAVPEAPQRDIIDGIHAVIGNYDDGSTDAEIIADAVAACVSAGHDIPAGYFDTVVAVLTLLPDDTDTAIFSDRFYELEEA